MTPRSPNVASIPVLLGFGKAALDQVGIATSVTGPLLSTVLGTVAGVIVIGVGGGLIEPVQSRWETMLNTAETESANVRAQARSSGGRSTVTTDAYPDEPSSSSTRTGRTVASSSDAPTETYGASTRR